MHNFHILLLNGPNLNLLGIREPKKYGTVTLIDVIKTLKILANQLKVKITHMQSNAEHILIECIHKYKDKIDYIIINPAAFTHTSIALRDSILAVNIPFIEVHISNIYKREKFRTHSYFSDIASGVICGFGTNGYSCALQMAVKSLSNCN